MRVEIHNAADLSAELSSAWTGLVALTPEFASPLVGPDFARLVGRYHHNAKIAVGFENQRPVAFFAFHPTQNGYARAIGAPYCDYQAIVSDPEVGFDPMAFLLSAGIKSLSCSSLMDPHQLFDHTDLSPVAGFRIDMREGSGEYEKNLRASNPKWAKNIRRLSNKMDRELGPLRFVAFDKNRASFDTLMAIKIDQFHRSGLTNVLGSKWVKALMDDLFNSQDQSFGGCLMSLYAGDKWVAGHFGVRHDAWFHPWIASTCPLSHPYSPGIVFLIEAINHSQASGISVIDLSAGHSHYKAQFCRNPVSVLSGVVGSEPKTAPSQDQGMLGLIARRMDQIASVEPAFLGQASAIGMAIAAAPQRLLKRQQKHESA